MKKPLIHIKGEGKLPTDFDKAVLEAELVFRKYKLAGVVIVGNEFGFRRRICYPESSHFDVVEGPEGVAIDLKCGEAPTENPTTMNVLVRACAKAMILAQAAEDVADFTGAVAQATHDALEKLDLQLHGMDLGEFHASTPKHQPDKPQS